MFGPVAAVVLPPIADRAWKTNPEFVWIAKNAVFAPAANVSRIIIPACELVYEFWIDEIRATMEPSPPSAW